MSLSASFVTKVLKESWLLKTWWLDFFPFNYWWVSSKFQIRPKVNRLPSSISMFWNCLGPEHYILDHELFQKVTEFYIEWKSLHEKSRHDKFISMPESVEIGLKFLFHRDHRSNKKCLSIIRVLEKLPIPFF